MKVNRETIVRTGLRLLNEIGLEQLTLRRLAIELKIQAPTIYWHFKSRQDLVDAMATLLLGEGSAALVPAKASADWTVWVSAFGYGFRKILLEYRDGARVVAGSRLQDTTYLAVTERIASRLLEAGFSLRDAAVLLSTVYTFTVSFVVEEQVVFPTPGERASTYDIDTRNAALDPAQFPLLRRAGAILFDSFDRRYKESLALIIRGASGRSAGS